MCIFVFACVSGVIQSSKNSLENWSKQVLHVWATSALVANIVVHVYDRIPSKIRANTVVIVTVAKNSHDIFANK